MMTKVIYLDYAATHPMRPAAIQAYTEAAQLVGNPASVHAAGQEAREKLEEGRTLIAEALRTDPRTLVACGGGTEADNQVVLGRATAWEEAHGKKGHLVTTQTEHAAVLAPMRLLAANGWDVTFLTPDQEGRYHPEQLRETLRADTALVSIHHVNNEIGTIQDTASLAAVAAELGIPYHTDAVQAAGFLPLRFGEWGVTYASLSAHKWGGGRGVGFLWIQRGAEVPPLLMGGGQEGGRRAGTQNTAGVYAAGVALKEAEAEREAGVIEHLTGLRTHFLEVLKASGTRFLIRHPSDSLPKIASIGFPEADGEALLMNLDLMGICASAGSACSAGTMQASHVLLALGISEQEARATLRFSFGATTTLTEIEQAAAGLAQAAEYSRLS